jgi:hypothetical protein
LRCLPDSPAKYNAEPPDQVARVKKHPALLRVLETWVLQQAAQIGAEIGETAAEPGAALAEWERLAARALMPRLAGFASWLKKAELEPSVRVALEGVAKRWRKRADDCVLDWAELFTDPAALTRGADLRGATSRSPTSSASSPGCAASSPGRRRRRSTRRATRCSTPRASRSASTRTTRPASSTTRTIRSCSAWSSSSAAA